MEAASVTSAPDGERLRAHLRGLWNSVAGGWAEHAAFTDERGAGVTRALLELVRPRAGERVLELACGAGGVGIAAAELVGETGEVVLSDVAPAMTAIARDRARSLGLTNVRTRELDLEAIDEPDGSFDVVVCREGIMLVPDPAQAAHEIARVLRPGGRVALAVWGPRERNPWLAIVFDTVSEQLGVQLPPPGIPGTVLARRRRPPRRPARRRRTGLGRGARGRRSLPRRVGRRVVEPGDCARRAARRPARVAARAGATVAARPRDGGGRGVRDRGWARAAGCHPDRRRAARLTGYASPRPSPSPAAATASTIASISASPCASEGKRHSYGLGATYTPRSSNARK